VKRPTDGGWYCQRESSPELLWGWFVLAPSLQRSVSPHSVGVHQGLVSYHDATLLAVPEPLGSASKALSMFARVLSACL
jgi:hypothetical protein